MVNKNNMVIRLLLKPSFCAGKCFEMQMTGGLLVVIADTHWHGFDFWHMVAVDKSFTVKTNFRWALTNCFNQAIFSLTQLRKEIYLNFEYGILFSFQILTCVVKWKSLRIRCLKLITALFDHLKVKGQCIWLILGKLPMHFVE